MPLQRAVAALSRLKAACSQRLQGDLRFGAASIFRLLFVIVRSVYRDRTEAAPLKPLVPFSRPSSPFDSATYLGPDETDPPCPAWVSLPIAATATRTFRPPLEFRTQRAVLMARTASKDARAAGPCIDARYAKAALSLRMNKTDTSDARDIAQIARVGWYREVVVKSMDTRALRAMLRARAHLV